MSARHVIVLFLLTSMIGAQPLPVYWSKSVTSTPVSIGRRALVIFVVGYTVDGYYAHCRLSNQSSAAVRVFGVRDSSGDFRAKATLAAASTQHGPWKKVGDVAPRGHKAALVVSPYSDSEVIIVDLNELASLIDKFQYAKISLPTGEATIFPIKELKH